MVRDRSQFLGIVLNETNTGMLISKPGQIQVVLIQIYSNDTSRFISVVDIMAIQTVSSTHLKQILPLQITDIGKAVFDQVVLPLFQGFFILHIERIVKHMDFTEGI